MIDTIANNGIKSTLCLAFLNGVFSLVTTL